MKMIGNLGIGLAATLLVALPVVASASCSSDAFTPPSATTIEGAPMEVIALEMWNDYKADPVAAAAKYEGKKLHFASVRVDQMSFMGEGGDYELYVQEGIDPNIEQVKFRTDNLSDIINVREEYIVEIVGKYENQRYGYVNVRIIWLKVIDPPGGDPNPPPEY